MQVTLNGFSAQFQKDADFFGRMDPYFIILQNGKQLYRSSVQNGAGKTPRWPDSTTLMVDPNSQFEVRFYDKDTFIDDSIGTAIFPGAQLLQPGVKSIPLQSRSNSGIFTFNAMPLGGGMGGFGGMGGMGGLGGMPGGMGGMGGMGGLGGLGGFGVDPQMAMSMM